MLGYVYMQIILCVLTLPCTSHLLHEGYLSAIATVRLIMSSMTVTVVCLLCVQTIAVYSQVQATQTCSNKEMRKAAVNEALTHRGCEDYNCGKFISTF